MRKEIEVRGITYPLELTLGALREFRKISGKEINEIKGLTDIAEFLYATAISTGRALSRPVAVTLDEFCDSLPFASVEIFTLLMEDSGLGVKANEDANPKKKR